MGKRIISLQEAQSVTNNDYLVIDNQSGGTKKVSAGFINDVLSGKQDTLVAGSNISIAADGKTISATDTTYTAGTNVQINNNVISATDTTYTAGTGIDITNGVISSDITPGSTVIITPALATGTKVADYSIDGTAGSLYAPNGGGSTVSVTQKTSTGTNIADITVDGVTTQLYAPNGGGGSSVIPNPTDPATDTLSSIEIDGTVYSVGGGGGDTGYRSTLLSDGTASSNVITLSNPYTDFDELLFTWTYNNLYISTLKLNTSSININDTITLNDYYNRDIVLTVTSATEFTITSQASGMSILSIRGFTYSKETKEEKRDTLWATGSWTMAHPVTDYDEIIFKWDENSSTSFIPTDIMTYQSFIVFKPANNSFMWFDVTDDSNFTVHQDAGLTITSVEGIVYTRENQSTKVEKITFEEYNALTPAQKTNGTVYFVGEATATSQLIPRVSGSDSAITSSHSYDSYYDWQAFNGVSSTDYRDPNNVWCPNIGEQNEWICYHFNSAKYFTKMTINCFSNYYSDWTGDIKIEASNDGTYWTNILKGGDTSKEITAYLAPSSEGGINEETVINIDLDSSTAYEYIRFVGIDPLMVWSGASCMVDEIYVYGASVPIVVEDYDIYFMGNKYTNNMDVTDLDFLDLKTSQVSDITTMLNSGTNNSDSGTFVSGTHQYEKVPVICGFKPDYVRVDFSLPGGATYAIYDSSVSTTTSHWIIPGEGNDYTIVLGSETGESGISDITDNGFKFRVNAGNTFEKTCTYTARVGGTTLVQTFDFSTLTQTQIDDLKSVLGLT